MYNEYVMQIQVIYTIDQARNNQMLELINDAMYYRRVNHKKQYLLSKVLYILILCIVYCILCIVYKQNKNKIQTINFTKITKKCKKTRQKITTTTPIAVTTITTAIAATTTTTTTIKTSIYQETNDDTIMTL